MSSEYPVPPAEEIDIVEVLRALADPVRLQVVRYLGDGMAHCKGQEAWQFGVQKSTMSHHLRLLREAGITETVVNGRDHWIRLRMDELEQRFPGLIKAVLLKP